MHWETVFNQAASGSLSTSIFKVLDSVGFLRAQNEEEEVDKGLAEGREVIKCIAEGDIVTAFSVSHSLLPATMTSLVGSGSVKSSCCWNDSNNPVTWEILQLK